MINPELEHAKTISEGYRNNNKGTVEKVKSYCPKSKCWTLEKVKVDKNAKPYYDSISKKKEAIKEEKRKATAKRVPKKNKIHPSSGEKIKRTYKAREVKYLDDLKKEFKFSKRFNMSQFARKYNLHTSTIHYHLKRLGLK